MSPYFFNLNNEQKKPEPKKEKTFSYKRDTNVRFPPIGKLCPVDISISITYNF